MGHSNVLGLDMHVLFGTKMFALLLGSMVFCIVNAKHVELLRQDGFDLRVGKVLPVKFDWYLVVLYVQLVL